MRGLALSSYAAAVFSTQAAMACRYLPRKSRVELIAKGGPWCGRVRRIEVLIVKRQLADLDDSELKLRRRHLNEGTRYFPAEGFLAQTADQDGDVSIHAHGWPLILCSPS